ncbi:MAG: hypothetical protein A2Z96_04710 [Spirochaetes bacterium GWB1_48_6]|nr:MAG: hypothetical protein A2Z96_04710 [Spirochaetes bacterium GWB1_48_6]
MNFFEKLEKRCADANTLLCIGLDPRITLEKGEKADEVLLAFGKRIIEATSAYAACFKPNIAFYEAWGEEGHRALKKTLALIPKDIPVLLDAKRGDIGPTAESYAAATFDYWGVDGVTVAPYMGIDSAEPFLRYPDKGIFVLARTSNPGAKKIQDWKVKKLPLYVRVAKLAASWGNRVGLVVAGNDTRALKILRRELPDTWFLSPGIGAQGGTIEDALSAGLRADGLGILPNVSREVASAADPAAKAKELRDAINQVRSSFLPRKHWKEKKQKLKMRLVEGLIKTECFRLGEFTLKSGLKSPFYVDLRRVQSDPKVLRIAAKAYAKLLDSLKFDRIAGIPVAALPLATAVSLEMEIPLIYPRIPPKAHGSGNAIEGDYKKGERIALLDDLITTGASKVEAIQVLRDQGLEVVDLVVLLERGVQGRKDMETLGVRTHAFLQIEDFLEPCHRLGLINDAKLAELMEFVKNS